MSNPYQPTGRTIKVEVPVVGEYKQQIVQTPDGLRWVHGKGSQDALAIHHEMDPPGHSIHDYIVRHFRPGLVFLDVGAHVGHYSIRAAKAGCTVYAVEANPECVAQLRLNMLINQVPDVMVWCVAAWDRTELLDLNSDPVDETFRSGGNSVMPMEGRRPMRLSVAGVALDDLEIPALDLVKIDTEGADLHVLEGMEDTIVRCRPKLIIEDHSIYGYYTRDDLEEMERQLSGLYGYRWKTAADEGVQESIHRIGIP